MSTGAELIAAERARQIEVEGYTSEHDDGHAEQLVRAAQCYVGLVLRGHHDQYAAPELERLNVPFLWPWAGTDWKPTGDLARDLVKAGALIAAAIDTIAATTGESIVCMDPRNCKRTDHAAGAGGTLVHLPPDGKIVPGLFDHGVPSDATTGEAGR